MTNFIIVLMTFEDIDQAKRISKILLERKHIACVNFINSIDSMYVWEGKICTNQETLAIAKTQKENFEKLKETVISEHTYATPEVISFSVDGGSSEYLQWVKLVTNKSFSEEIL